MRPKQFIDLASEINSEMPEYVVDKVQDSLNRHRKPINGSRILVMGAGMAGNPTSSRVFSLSDDGKHMIETIIRHQPDGTPYMRVNTWSPK